MAMIPMENIGGGYAEGAEEVIGSITISGTTYPVYRKIIDFGALPSNVTQVKSIAHNISGFSIEKVLNLYGRAYGSGDTCAIPYVNNNGYLSCYVTATAVAVVTSANWSMYTGKITIEYYK